MISEQKITMLHSRWEISIEQQGKRKKIQIMWDQLDRDENYEKGDKRTLHISDVAEIQKSSKPD